jgi:pyridoxal phosphate enzyme (YggS family)
VARAEEEVTEVGERLAAVKERIARAAAASGREAGEVTLIAVSKKMPASAIRAAYAAGQRAFGENYAQELDDKATELADLPDLEWHFIGHLQSNKAKLVAKAARVLHTIDGPSLARAFGKRAAEAGGARRGVLIEVNVAAEPQKFGVAPGEIAEVMAAIAGEPALALMGLMTVPPAGGPAIARRVFETLATLRALHGGKGRLPELSMGMSGDLEAAIACGATMVRVGSAIFGERC